MAKNPRQLLYFLDQKLLLQPGTIYTIGRDADSSIRLPGQTTSRKHAVIKFENDRFVITDLDSTNSVRVNGKKIATCALGDGDHIVIGISYLIYRETDGETVEDAELDSGMSDTIEIEQQLAQLLKYTGDKKIQARLIELKDSINRVRHKLSTLANRDRLTGLFNRRYFDHESSREIERARRYAYPLALFMIDIDHFKNVNDEHGHRKGDEALRAVGALIRENTRQNDLAARYGGEEMAIILPEMNPDQAAGAAEKIRGLIERDTPLRTGLPLTVSIGIAIFRKKDTVKSIIERADRALYEAKKRGRNRVVHSQIINHG